MKTVKLRPNASRRTRNRLTEHTNLRVVGTNAKVDALGKQPGVLLECTVGLCKWFGWVPADEVIIIHSMHKN